MGVQSFRISAPVLWNSLPPEMRNMAKIGTLQELSEDVSFPGVLTTPSDLI